MRELAKFVPELANFEEYLCSKFEEELSLEIRKNMYVSGSQSYKEVVQLALRVEKLTDEKMSLGNFQKKKDLVSYLVSHRRRFKVLTFWVILLVWDLDQSALLNLFDPLNLLT